MNRLDHIVLAADSLAQGVDYLRATLGIEIPPGGRHQTMGTHNCLMQLGDDAYLELIAIDPAAAAPGRPRWFELDRQLLRDALRRQPRLITWVINTPDLDRLAARVSFDLGVPTRLTRDRLEWRIGLTDDGRLLDGGMLPYCIQWHSRPHPSRAMADLGCRLRSLTLHHNRPDWIAARLDELGARELVGVAPLSGDEAPFLEAEVETPGGVVTIA